MIAFWPPQIALVDAFGAGVYAMTLAHHLDQWWRRRDRASHLWIALSALGALLVNFSGAMIREADVPPGRAIATINMLGVALALVSLYELVRAHAGRQARKVRRVLQAITLLPALVYVLTGNTAMVPALYLLSLVFLLFALAMSVRDAMQGDIEARVLAVGLCVLFATLLYDLASELALVPRQQGWPILGFSVLYLAATRAQSIRQEREYEELRSLRGELEERVRKRTVELEAANAHLDLLSRTDPLTGLGNRRAFVEHMSGQVSGSLVMIDVDHFKQINDRFGHDAGDRALIATAAALRGSFGDDAVLARWGGEEFIAHLPSASLEAACAVAEAARRALAVLRAGAPDAGTLSASFGVAQLAPGGDLERSLAAADAALYRAKQGGRDRVVAA
jgi:diguanylate cyclase (GGDEF)-like protein